MRVAGLIADNIETSTQPSTPKPVANATSGENSSMAQRSTAFGEAVSNSSEIAFKSFSVVFSLIDSAVIDISHFQFAPLLLTSHRERCHQFFFVDHNDVLLKPVKAFTQ